MNARGICRPRRAWAVLALLFCAIFAAYWWFLPAKPYAAVRLSQETRLLQFSPDNSMLVTCGRSADNDSVGPIRIWDIAAGVERFSVGHDLKDIGVEFSPDNALIAAYAREGDMIGWSSTTGEVLVRFSPVTFNRNWVHYRFSPDSRFLLFSDYSQGWPKESFITFWNVKTNQKQGSMESGFSELACSPDGKTLVTHSWNERRNVITLKHWQIESALVLVEEREIEASRIAFSPDLTVMATADELAGGRGEVALRDFKTGEKRWSETFNLHGLRLISVEFGSNGKILKATSSGGTNRYDWKFGTTVWNLNGTPKLVGSYSSSYSSGPAISPNGKWLAVSRADGAQLVNITAPEQTASFVNSADNGYYSGDALASAMFSPDSKTLAIRGINAHSNRPPLDNWLPRSCNPYAAIPDRPFVRVWSVDAQKEVLMLEKCSSVLFSPNGRTMAAVRDGNLVELWAVPLQASPWRIVGWATLVWAAVLLAYWPCLIAWRVLRFVTANVFSIFRRRKPTSAAA
ncbi:MAG TPA: hypothetical protein VE988_28700 [Gemmataceae bacterium]|nr:hypothetical protein [Gemmataceae bacterium]